MSKARPTEKENVKKKRMEEEMRVLMKSADSNAEEAESNYLISKSNRLKRAAKEKRKVLKL